MTVTTEHEWEMRPGDIHKITVELNGYLQAKLFIIAYESGRGICVDVINLDSNKFTARALTWAEGSRHELTFPPTSKMQRQVYCIEITKKGHQT
jgi:hypothetical protein